MTIKNIKKSNLLNRKTERVKIDISEEKYDQYLIQLTKILFKQQSLEDLSQRNEKFKRILLLLAQGATIATVLLAPNTAKLFKNIDWERSHRNEWKVFNINYLRRTLRKLEKQKIIAVEEKENFGIVKLTNKGKAKILKSGIDSLTIPKPARWDGKWRLIFYDVLHGKRNIRDKFRSLLKNAGFYPLQESVYLHAYPCEDEIEFFRIYLGISGEVRIIEAIKIENDQQFREYFNI